MVAGSAAGSIVHPLLVWLVDWLYVIMVVGWLTVVGSWLHDSF